MIWLIRLRLQMSVGLKAGCLTVFLAVKLFVDVTRVPILTWWILCFILLLGVTTKTTKNKPPIVIKQNECWKQDVWSCSSSVSTWCCSSERENTTFFRVHHLIGGHLKKTVENIKAFWSGVENARNWQASPGVVAAACSSPHVPSSSDIKSDHDQWLISILRCKSVQLHHPTSPTRGAAVTEHWYNGQNGLSVYISTKDYTEPPGNTAQ